MTALVDQLAVGIRVAGESFGLAYAKSVAFDNLAEVVESAPHLAPQAVDTFRAVIIDVETNRHLSVLEAAGLQPLDEVMRDVEAKFLEAASDDLS